MLRLAAEAQELVTVQVACDMAERVPGERSEVCQDWTLQLLPLRRALLRLAGHFDDPVVRSHFLCKHGSSAVRCAPNEQCVIKIWPYLQ